MYIICILFEVLLINQNKLLDAQLLLGKKQNIILKFIFFSKLLYRSIS